MEIEHRDGVPIARPTDDIDASNATQLREQLAGSLDTRAPSLVIDLTETRYVDSAGIDMLLRLGELLLDRRTTLLLVLPRSSPLTRLAEIVGLGAVLPIHETVESAVAAALSSPASRPDPSEDLPAELT